MPELMLLNRHHPGTSPAVAAAGYCWQCTFCRSAPLLAIDRVWVGSVVGRTNGSTDSEVRLAASQSIDLSKFEIRDRPIPLCWSEEMYLGNATTPRMKASVRPLSLQQPHHPPPAAAAAHFLTAAGAKSPLNLQSRRPTDRPTDRPAQPVSQSVPLPSRVQTRRHRHRHRRPFTRRSDRQNLAIARARSGSFK